MNWLALSLPFLIAGCSSVSNKGTEVDTKALKPVTNLEIIAEKSEIIEGGLTLIRLNSPNKIESVSGEFLSPKSTEKQKFKFYPDDESGMRFAALVGVEFGTESGNFEIEANACESAGKCTIVKKSITVVKGVFPSEKLTVAPRKVTPTKKDMIRIKRDLKLLGKVYASSVFKKYFDLPVQLPINDVITSKYGSHRVYNHKHTNAHLGTDFRAAVGTKVITPLTGVVVLAEDLFYTGNTVIIDHGYDFFTIYAHLSKLLVNTGVVLKKGEVMGLSGATGRVSGPHLHWGMRLHGKKIDPMYLVGELN